MQAMYLALELGIESILRLTLVQKRVLAQVYVAEAEPEEGEAVANYTFTIS